MDALLVLEDGRVFPGQSFGAPGERTGEVVFNTGMTGYQEIITDPSYHGQLVVMTAPHIGNTGMNALDPESWQPQVAGLIVRAASPLPSSWRAEAVLGDALRHAGIVALTEVDTRALTRHIRTVGALRGIISTETSDVAALIGRVRAAPTMIGSDLTHDVTCEEPYAWVDRTPAPFGPGGANPARLHVVAFDFGLKRTILRQLADRGCRITVVPATTRAEEVLALHPDGVFYSNGPGDPAAAQYAVDTLRQLVGRVPVFGICLGHQLLGLALGGQTFKLPFGHHAINHPVKELATGRVEITSQNHGFAVAPESLPADVEVTHINLNDGTVEGLRHRTLPAFSVQYHPEAGPGPHDATYLFDRFLAMMETQAA